ADVLTPETGFPVEYTLIPVPPGAYPFAESQHWAEPDIAHAACLMRQVADDPVTARAVAARGQARVRRDYSPEAAGRRYRARLEELGWL
ncbi:glycosyltransferase, partial [Oceanibaculum nanhaiense]|uniref:glycosyltransferase n=1 Tax=Oceanibaculum nanhaiense TaxID=1909734 RepID=UPI00396D7786